MDLSIIIPTYNRAGLVRFTLDSLSKEKHPGVAYEVIVIDDNSTDSTTDIIASEYPWVRLLKNRGKGAAAARNIGLHEAKGTYILYLDSDDLVGENYFIEKIKFLDRNKSLNACYGSYEYFQGEASFAPGDIIFRFKYSVSHEAGTISDHLEHYLEGDFIPCMAIMWRKELLLKIGGQNESLIINQDVDLFFRAIFAGLSISFIDDSARAYVRHHEIDIRVGNGQKNPVKWLQLLQLRREVLHAMAEAGYTDVRFREVLSTYIFGWWKELRHFMPDVAAQYLAFAKTVYWPLKVKGALPLRVAAKLLGPVTTAKLKYLLVKHD